MRKRSTGAHSSQHRVNLIDDILGAAAEIGSDGRGRDGLVGYLISLAKKHPQEFATKLLVPLIDLEPSRDVAPPKVFRTPEEIMDDLRSRGLPVPPDMFS